MAVTSMAWPHKLGLHCGEWVVVRSRQEILSTLDERGRLQELPFQPEMLAFCGQRLRVAKVAHKTCDNIKKTGGRKMTSAVHLEGARCDGAAHGGCMADCVFFWKEAWVKRLGDPEGQPLANPLIDAEGIYRCVVEGGDLEQPDPKYVCQTTALYEATSLLPWWDVRQYVRDVTSGNHSPLHMLRILALAWYRALLRLGFGYRFLIGLYKSVVGKAFPSGTGTIPVGSPTPNEVLNLQPGEWVEVKSQDEILGTINADGFNRGMRYDMEMSKYAGNRYRVQMRVDRLINEQTGKMMEMKSPCIQLENVYCRAECTSMRLGCPRASNTYWREIWLRRVDGPSRP
jgi:hypothetical protein